jgi:hypothetical protein
VHAGPPLLPPPPGAPSDWASLVDKPRELYFRADVSKSEDGARWIRMELEFEVTLRASSAFASDACWYGTERAAEIFSRVDSVRILSREPTLVISEQLTGVRILGLAFLAKGTYRNELRRDSPAKALVSWTLEETDGSVRGNTGYWYFEEVRGGADPLVYVRYQVVSEVEARFPGQLGIMRAFGPGDIKALLMQFAREVYRLAGKPSG